MEIIQIPSMAILSVIASTIGHATLDIGDRIEKILDKGQNVNLEFLSPTEEKEYRSEIILFK
jgi:hypothetical protein